MSRTIKQIKDEMTACFVRERAVITCYGIDPRKSFSQQFSPVSIENILFYVFAYAVWVLETLFDKHKAETVEYIAALEPHTLRWYVRKTREFMYGYRLIRDTDQYDTTNMSETDIQTARIVRYAVASEENSIVYLKVSGQKDGRPQPLNTSQAKAFKAYINDVKDAGVAVEIRNELADMIQINLQVYYDPTLMNGNGEDINGEKPVNDAVQKVITDLPFDGVLRVTDILAAVKNIQAVEVVDLAEGGIKAKAHNADVYTTVRGYVKPFSGFYEINELNVTYIEYTK